MPYLIPNCEAKRSWAGLVLAWGTSWEPHGDLTFLILYIFFCFFCKIFSYLLLYVDKRSAFFEFIIFFCCFKYCYLSYFLPFYATFVLFLSAVYETDTAGRSGIAGVYVNGWGACL